MKNNRQAPTSDMIIMPEDNPVIEESVTVLMSRIVELEKVNKIYREELCKLRVIKALVKQMIRENKTGQISIRTLGKIDNLMGVKG